MHREVLGLEPGDGLAVDHINGNGLDNRRENLRIADKAQNQHNCVSRMGRSHYKGVAWAGHVGMWRVRLRRRGVSFHVGYFRDEIDAALAYDLKAAELFGEFARPNFLTARRSDA